MLQKLKLLFHTLKYLRLRQLYYQGYYRAKNRFFKRSYHQKAPETATMIWKCPIRSENSWTQGDSFTFLNLERSFKTIDWNYPDFGKLWTYNLTYFDFLNQEDITQEEGLRLIGAFIQKEGTLKDALEPYPISLRGMNWIKFLSRYRVQDREINNCLFNHYQRLYANVEYHLMGNHLLENGFSLLFAAVFFKNEKFYKRASKILWVELNEQILEDGAHFELSPMYHQIILYRLLDCLNLAGNDVPINKELLDLMESKSIQMLGWLQTVTFKNGNIPMVNDSTFGIAPSSKELFEYGKHLGLKWTKIELKESGYRKWSTDFFECFIDVGDIGPDYIPGHANADSLQFLLQYKNRPVIVDTGISTYEKNERRHVERSTSSHNTVTINGFNSSEVWGGFRVAQRAKITLIKDEVDYILASHNGYRNAGIVHERCFERSNNTIIIKDNIIGIHNGCESLGHLHFHPYTKLDLRKNKLNIDELIEIEFLKTGNIKLSDYMYAEGFNELIPAKKILFAINGYSEIKINFLKP